MTPLKSTLLAAVAASAAALLPHPAASAQSPADEFNRIVASVVAHNPQLAADEAATRAEILRQSADNNLADTEVDFDRTWGTTPEAGNKWSLTVSQSFDWPGVYAARRKAARQGRLAAESRQAAALRQKVLEAKLMLLDVVYANQQVAALQAISQNMAALVQATDSLFSHGEATILEVKKIRFEQYDVSVQLDDALEQLGTLSRNLAALNGGEAVDVTLLTDYPHQSLLSEQDYLQAADPTLTAMARSAEAARLTARAERLKSWPGFSVGYVHETEGSERFNGFSVGLSLPIFSRRHVAAAARADRLAMQYQLDDATLARRAEIISNVAGANKMKRQIDAYHEIFGQEYPELLERAYRGGTMTQHVYLSEINDYLRRCSEHLLLTLSYHRTLATLNSLLP